MTVGNPAYRTQAEARKNPALQFTCLASPMTRSGYRYDFPIGTCAGGIMVTVRFPTWWDGKNIDSPDRQSHMAYPVSRACPDTHQVKVPEVFYGTYWDTTPFNDKKMWPEDGSQPFVWSFDDRTGFGNHGDYMFGSVSSFISLPFFCLSRRSVVQGHMTDVRISPQQMEGDALQRALDANCNSDLLADKVNCPTLKLQSIKDSNKCTVPRRVKEDLDGWLHELPGASEMTK